MIFRQPIFTIARILTTFILRSTGLNSLATSTLVMNTFDLISQIYSRFRFLTSIQSIFVLFNLLRNRASINSNILNRAFLNNHPELKVLFLQYILPHWEIINTYRRRFLFVLTSVSLSSFIALVRPIWFIRFTFGIIFSSLCILWNESLSSFIYLKKGALFVLDLLDNYAFNFPIPNKSDLSFENRVLFMLQ